MSNQVNDAAVNLRPRNIYSERLSGVRSNSCRVRKVLRINAWCRGVKKKYSNVAINIKQFTRGSLNAIGLFDSIDHPGTTV